jgi:hypothetical protein
MHPVHGTLRARETKQAQLIHLRSGDDVEPEALAEVMQAVCRFHHSPHERGQYQSAFFYSPIPAS